MKAEIICELNKNSERPTILLREYGIQALLDTGSLIPVWTADPKILFYLNASIVKENIEFSGFGVATTGDIYQIPYFSINGLVFPNMHIVVSGIEENFSMILSATMFSNLSYEYR